MNKIDMSGAWTADMYSEHLPECVAFDKGLIDHIINVCQPQKVLDLGCGQGFFIKYLREQGIDAWGVEGENLDKVFQSPGYQIIQDISQPFDLNEKFDLVICLEVVEHIPHEWENTVFDNIVKHMSKYLLFSGATPGQQGTGHINERLESYWFAQLSKRGLVLRHQDSVNARQASVLPWYVKNISLWEIIHPDAYNYDNLISERDSYILKSQTHLNQFKANLEQTTQHLQNLQSQLNSTLSEVERLQKRIAAMETSKFWHLRQQWFKVKKSLGIKGDD